VSDVRVFADYTADFQEEADVVVVGSGPGGAVVAYALAAAGKSVVLIEEGPPFVPSEFETDGGVSMTRTLRESGLRSTVGTVMPTMQAIALGGGSLVNSAICNRAPDFVLDRWSEDYALRRSSLADLDPHYDATGKMIGVADTPEAVQGRRNLLFRDGCDALGFSSEPIARNVRGCVGSGECFTGCRSRAKQSMDISVVPAALRLGARVLTSARVERIEMEGARATGVSGHVVAPFTGVAHVEFRVRAKAVVLAAGCMGTPTLLQKSGNLANGSGQAGRNLRFHPGVAVTGIFPDRVDPQFGATQGYQSKHFLREGFKMETLWAPPPVLAVRMPGYGADLKRRLAELPFSATWDAIASCNRSVGTVTARRDSFDPRIRWHLSLDDISILERALARLMEVFFAAGAARVIPGVYGLPDEIGSLDEARTVMRDRAMRPGDFVTAGNHAFCTTRMHGDPAKGVVDELGRCHDHENLWIADTGVFPECPSVNPMWTAMALAHRTAQTLAREL
jgi:choline dehydrogenase-like flavoprotein